MEKIFIYKEQNTNDRDCVKYIDNEKNIKGDIWFTNVGLTGACFSCSLELDKIDFDNITTILTKEEFKLLDNFNRSIRGSDLWESIIPIFKKLRSKENQDLFEKVKLEEIEYLKDEYSLDDNDIETIFNNYYLDYRDRGIVSSVYKDIYDLGYESAWSFGTVNEESERYFDYEKFGEDLLNGGDYVELEDGRIVYVNY